MWLGDVGELILPSKPPKLRRLLARGLKELKLPNGMNYAELFELQQCNLEELVIPDGFGVSPLKPYPIYLKLNWGFRRLSVGRDIPEFEWSMTRNFPFFNLTFKFLPAVALIKNMQLDADGVYRIESILPPVYRHRGGVFQNADGTYRIESTEPVTLEIRGAPNPLTISRKAERIEVRWSHGVLQHSLLGGPWMDVDTGDEKRHFIRSPHPYGFFRIKP